MARPSKRRQPEQLTLPGSNTWGGKREGAGRKRRNDSGIPHRSREPMRRRMPLHVTMRMSDRVYNLRSRRSLKVMTAALRAGGDRFDVRVVQVSVQGNHIHLLVEAPDARALGRAMKGLAIRVALGMNKMMASSGRVMGDRYHSRVLRSPTEVRTVMYYIRHNQEHHFGERGVDEYSNDGLLAGLLPAPALWVLREGWRRGRLMKVPVHFS